MQDEISILEANKTWELVDLSPNKQPIRSKWIYKIKCKADGSLEHYKALLIAKGYTQHFGIDYLEIFSPVAQMTTVWLLLSFVAIDN